MAVDEPGWEVDPDDEWGLAVIATVGRQLKLRREAMGMNAAEFGTTVGYGEDMIYKLEGGRRIPRPEFLDKADEVLSADGLLKAMKEDVAKVRYPKKVRDLAKLEATTAEMHLYDPLNIHGLLQTPEYAHGLLAMRRPAYTKDEVERYMAARVARKAIFDRDRSRAQLRPGGVDAAPPARRPSDTAPTARTPAGDRQDEEHRAACDAHGLRGARRGGRRDRGA